ncbi:MAG: signal peptidase I [Clostridia bacterium]|nr:signal peptidase I [Clostridia bacterium]
MQRDKKILYGFSIVIMLLLLITALFIPTGSSRYTAATLLLASAGMCCAFIKKRSILSYNKNQVLGLMIVIALVFVMLLYLMGLYFGYMSSYSSFGKSFFNLILPNTIIIIAIEIVRSIMLAQKNKTVNVICYISCVLADILIMYSLANVETFNRFIDIIALALLPAITANTLYHYVSEKYGKLPNIAYRLIITLYAYIMPIVPAITEALSSLIKVILPLVVFAFIAGLYEKKRNYAVAKKKTWFSLILLVITIILMISIVMLISCQFKYGALVIATGSMTGELNKGDIAIYESYDGQFIEVGQVIVFKKGDSKVVHRVAKIENVDGTLRYYTKGDIYKELDAGYVLESDIIGLAYVKVPYLGYPTIWLRNAFN